MRIGEIRGLLSNLGGDIDNVKDAYEDIVRTCDTSAWPIEHQEAQEKLIQDISYSAYHLLRFTADNVMFCQRDLEDLVTCTSDDVSCYSDSDDEE